MKPFKIDTYKDIGKREKNQDAILAKTFETESGHITACLACDGVGSFEYSELASGFITSYFERFFDENAEKLLSMELDEIENCLYEKVKDVHERLIYIAKEKNVEYGSTLTLFLSIENTYIVVQVGDSRCYILENGVLRQITKDQLLEGSQKLIQCVGYGVMEPKLYDGIFSDKASFLICTDGLTKRLTFGAVSKALKTKKTAYEKLVSISDKARTLGETDNISAALLTLD